MPIVRRATAAEWDDLVRSSPQGSVFCSLPFLSAYGAQHDLWVVDHDGTIVLGAPVLIDVEGRPLPQPLPFTMYQGPLFAAWVTGMPTHRRVPASLGWVELLLEQLGATYGEISFSLHHAHDDLRALTWFHYDGPEEDRFTVHLRYTGLLDAPTDLDAYFASIRAVRRQEARRARRDGWQMAPLDDVNELDRLHRLTFERQGIDRSAEDGALIRRIADGALAHGFGDLLAARSPAGAIASVVLFLHDERCAYYLIGANDPDSRGTGASTDLLLHAIAASAARGVRHVDFVGINSPQRGDYKVSFGARPVPYYDVAWAQPS